MVGLDIAQAVIIYPKSMHLMLKILDSIATTFERRIYFGFGRHLWNIAGVAGVVAITISGVIIASNPETRAMSKDVWIMKLNWKDNASVELYEKISRARTSCQASRSRGYNKSQSCIRYGQIKKDEVQAEENYIRIMQEYDQYKISVQGENLKITAKREASKLVILAGLVTIAIASMSSAILAIERNTREIS